MIALSICWSCVCRSECLLFSKICSNSEAKQAQTKSNAPPRGDYDQGTGKQSDTWKSLERCQHFLKLFRISFSGWIDNRNFALRCVEGRLRESRRLSAFFSGVSNIQASGRKKKSNLRDLLHLQSNMDTHHHPFPTKWLFSWLYPKILVTDTVWVQVTEMHFYFTSLQFEIQISQAPIQSRCADTFHSSALVHQTASGTLL